MFREILIWALAVLALATVFGGSTAASAETANQTPASK